MPGVPKDWLQIIGIICAVMTPFVTAGLWFAGITVSTFDERRKEQTAIEARLRVVEELRHAHKPSDRGHIPLYPPHWRPH